MKKFIVITLLVPVMVFAQLPSLEEKELLEPMPSDMVYSQTSLGYIDMPMKTALGMVATNNRQSEIYLISDDGTLTTLVAAPGAGRYMHLSPDGTKIAFKYINENDEQAPAVLDLNTREVVMLADFAFQCGQPSYAQDGTVAYTLDNQLIVQSDGVFRQFEMPQHVNIANIAPDGSYVAFANGNGEPMMLNLENGEMTMLYDEGDCFINTISPEGGHIVYEQAKGMLFVYDLSSGIFQCIGRGSSAQWLDEDHIVYCRPEYVNGNVFAYMGTSVVTDNFMGTDTRVIIDTNRECPQQVAVMDENHIAVPFSYGHRRLSVMDINQPADEIVLCELEDGMVFGDDLNRRERNTVSPRRKPSQTTLAGTIGIHDIPYINQVYDTPDSYAGCHDYGSVACGPTTSCMLLAYYELLDKHAVTSRRANCAWGQTNYYSWYVGQQYTASQTGFTFSSVAEGKGCNAKGAYGYMWNGSNSPNSRMVGFYKNNGIKDTKHNDTGLGIIRSECAADRPYSWCITSAKSGGHLILPFRVDAKCVKVNGVWTLQEGKTGSLVVQDPYGDANNSSWLGDGRYSTYDYNGYNNGYFTMVNAWGVTVSYARNAVHVTEVQLDRDSVTLHVGESVVLSATVLPVNATDNSVSWGSTANRVAMCAGASIPLTQRVVAKGVGEASICVKTTDGAKTACCVITVVESSDLDDVNMPNSSDTKKCVIDGRLVIVRNGIGYDLVGNRVKMIN